MTTRITGLASLALAAGLGLAALSVATNTAEAGSRNFSLQVGPGGFGLSVGPRHGYQHGYYPRRSHYSPYYYSSPRRHYRNRYRSGCQYKARKCARNWGWRNHNWRGCMRYYGCR